MAAKKTSRQKRQNSFSGHGAIPASACQVGDMVSSQGKRWRLTAINGMYAMLRESDRAGAELRFVTPDTQLEGREPYVPRVGGGGVDPLTKE